MNWSIEQKLERGRMYIIGGAQLKFVYMLVDSFFFFGKGHGPPKGQRGSAPGPGSQDGWGEEIRFACKFLGWMLLPVYPYPTAVNYGLSTYTPSSPH